QLRTTSSKVIHKLSTRILNAVIRFNVRQTVTNADLKRFTDDIRTIRRPTVANVRKSYPQANKSYPQASQLHSKLSTTYPQVIHSRNRTCVRRGGGGGANVCLGRRASKRFLQIFKTRVVI